MSRASAAGVNPRNTSRPNSRVMPRAKCSASNGMSSARSRNEGTVTTSKASRSRRSLRKRPPSASAGRSTLVAAMTRTSTWCTSLPPTRSKLPYSMTRRIFSCTASEAVAISSRNKVPPSAISKRERRRCVAPVKAPASWPKSSLSSRLSASVAQLSLTKGLSQRGERKVSRAATNSLPVPRSPTTSTGRSSAASCETCANAARKAGASPTSGGKSRSVLGENTNLGRIYQLSADIIYAKHRAAASAERSVQRFQWLNLNPRDWHGACLGGWERDGRRPGSKDDPHGDFFPPRRHRELQHQRHPRPRRGSGEDHPADHPGDGGYAGRGALLGRAHHRREEGDRAPSRHARARAGGMAAPRRARDHQGA